jgi:hypothetical protein
MRTVIVIAVLILALRMLWDVAGAKWGRRQRGPQAVTFGDIPAVFAALSSSRTDGNFAAFLFGAAGQPPASMDALNIQFSIDGGRAGIDWVLLAPPNVEAQPRFVAFFEGKGRTVLQREMNEVKYLRVEGEQLPELMQEFLRAGFEVEPDQKMELIAEGFSWAG